MRSISSGQEEHQAKKVNSEFCPRVHGGAYCCLKRKIERIGGRVGSWNSKVAKVKLENLQLCCKLWMENTGMRLVDLVSVTS